MPLMPKRVKFRKNQRGRVRGNACRGNTVAHGEFGLQSLEGGWLSAEAIEAGRVTVAQFLRGEGRLTFASSRISRSPPSRRKPAWAKARVSRNTGPP